MHVFTDFDGTIAKLKESIDQALNTGQAESLLVLSCDENNFTPEQLDPLLKEVPVPIFGGTFPIVMSGARQMKRGSVVVAFHRHVDVHFIPGMSDPDMDYEGILDELVDDDDDLKTLMVFVDGMSQRIAAFIEALYAVFGLDINYIGGGAGSLQLKPKPCLITNEGLLEDGGVVASLHMESGVGVSHGWTTISGPYKVTEAERNVIKSLDWKPAFEVYREVVEAHSNTPFMSLPFFDIAKSYPFGIAKLGTERVVRDPHTLDGDRNLICVGEVSEGSYVDILHAEPHDLIRAAGMALDKAKKDYSAETAPGLGFVIDCVSRVLFLEDEFVSELEAVVVPEVEFVGVCSMGEIANSGQDYLEFFNKTAVVAFLEGD